MLHNALMDELDEAPFSAIHRLAGFVAISGFCNQNIWKKTRYCMTGQMMVSGAAEIPGV
jgi:hypothetical protein